MLSLSYQCLYHNTYQITYQIQYWRTLKCWSFDKMLSLMFDGETFICWNTSVLIWTTVNQVILIQLLALSKAPVPLDHNCTTIIAISFEINSDRGELAPQLVVHSQSPWEFGLLDNIRNLHSGQTCYLVQIQGQS